MTLSDYLRVLRERWLVILLSFLIGGGAAAGAWLLQAKEYTATTTLYVSAQTAGSTITAYQGAQLSEQRVASYVEMINGRRIRADVAADLGSTDVGSLQASSTSGSVLIDVSAVHSSPQRVL